MEKRYGIPVFLDHDIQSAALVEQLYGNGRDYQDVLVLGIEEGVGSGIMVGGHRYQSNSGYPPEMGHVSINHHGRKCVAVILAVWRHILDPGLWRKNRGSLWKTY